MDINYTQDGSLGITTDGWMVKRTTAGWLVFDAEDVFVGRFDTDIEAEIVATTREPWAPEVTA